MRSEDRAARPEGARAGGDLADREARQQFQRGAQEPLQAVAESARFDPSKPNGKMSQPNGKMSQPNGKTGGAQRESMGFPTIPYRRPLEHLLRTCSRVSASAPA